MRDPRIDKWAELLIKYSIKARQDTTPLNS